MLSDDKCLFSTEGGPDLRKILVVLLAFGFFAAPALAANGQQTTTLFTPSGQPVGGKWQRWMNDSYMPTYDGPMVIDFSRRSTCQPRYDPPASEIAACTAGATFTAPVAAAVRWYPETLINTRFVLRGTSAPYRRYILMYEQGHLVDYFGLTDNIRAELIALWGRSPLPADEQMAAYWWQGESRGHGRVYGEWFSESYALCSLYRHWDRAAYINARNEGRSNSYSNGYPGWGRSASALRVQDATCALIRTLSPQPED